MKQLITIYEKDIDQNLGDVDVTSYGVREAARAVITDIAGHIYLLNVSLRGYHKLPGGGIKKGEDAITALKRELREEVGCEAEIIAEIGAIVEYRDFAKLKQASYCYLAKQVGEQSNSSLEADELAEGMFQVKTDDIDAAIALLEKDEPNNIEGMFIQKRDLVFLKAAKDMIK